MAKATIHKLTGIKARARREGWLSAIRSEADEHAALNGCYFSREHADHVVEFFPQFLRHSKGEWAGQPFELLDWQREEVISPLFGWLRETGYRRFRQTFIEVPKKNGKSTLAAGVGCYMLAGDGEGGAEVYSAATDREQASIVHNEAINMIDASPELSAVLKINRSTRNIEFPAKKSYYRAVSAKPAGKEGFNGHCCICDEVHVWKGRELWDALRYMGRARRQSLIFAITTGGSDLLSVCYELLEYARKILQGVFFDDRFFAYVRECSKEELQIEKSDIKKQTGLYNREKWRQANPSMGITIDEEEFESEVTEALQSPASLASFLRYSFNVWSTAETPWLDIGKWGKAADPRSGGSADRAIIAAIEKQLQGERCGAALDLAKILDMTALALCFREEVTAPSVGGSRREPHEPLSARADYTPDATQDLTDWLYRLLVWFWMPRVTAEELSAKGLAPYLMWAEQGWLTLTDGDVVDYAVIKRDVLAIADRFRIYELAFDPWNAEDTTQQLEAGGIKRKECRQTIANFAHPTKEFERLLAAGRLIHPAHPILTWQAGHVNVWTDASGNIRPVKPPHGDYRKIDGIVAAIMALDRAMHMPRAPKGSLLIY